MDKRLQKTLDYAKEEIQDIEKLDAEGKLNDKGVFIRIFSLGKVMLGWDDDIPVADAIERFMRANNTVNEVLNSARRSQAS